MLHFQASSSFSPPLASMMAAAESLDNIQPATNLQGHSFHKIFDKPSAFEPHHMLEFNMAACKICFTSKRSLAEIFCLENYLIELDGKDGLLGKMCTINHMTRTILLLHADLPKHKKISTMSTNRHSNAAGQAISLKTIYHYSHTLYMLQ